MNEGSTKRYDSCGIKTVARRFAIAALSLLSRWKLRGVTTVGAGARVRGSIIVENRGTMRIGRNVVIWGHVARSQLTTSKGAVLEIGDDSFINCGATVAARKSVRIGKRVQIANLVTIMDSDFHGVESRDATPDAEEIVIDDDAWIAVKATILKGVTIGKGAVVAAGAVVTKSVPPYSLAGGIPARVIRTFAPGGGTS
ncbi:MAG: acyltransferase [bacterium]